MPETPQSPSGKEQQRSSKGGLLSKLKHMTLSHEDKERQKVITALQQAFLHSGTDVDDQQSTPTIQIQKAFQYGFRGTPTVFAYDPAQKLLAFATSTGALCVMGQPGVERYFQNKTRVASSIRFLAFKINDGLLLSLDHENYLTGWNLVRGSIDYEVKIPERITAWDVPTGTRWIFLGSEQGNVIVYDGELGQRSTFTIPSQFIEHETLEGSAEAIGKRISPAIEDLSVVAVAVHPHDYRKLMIVYAGGVVVLLDFIDLLILKRFELKKLLLRENEQPPKLTSFAWRVDGKDFVCGSDNGTLIFWTLKNEQHPVHIGFVDDFQPAPQTASDLIGSGEELDMDAPTCTAMPESKTLHEPIYQLAWTSLGDGNQTSWLFVSGGAPLDQTILKGIRILEYRTRKTYCACRRQQFLSTGDVDINYFMPLCDSAWYPMTPKAVMLLLSDGRIKVNDCSGMGLPQMKIPAVLDFLNLEAYYRFRLVYHTPIHLFNRFIALAPPLQQGLAKIVTGGLVGARMARSDSLSSVELSNENEFNTNVVNTEILVTAHKDKVYFWSVADITLQDSGNEISLALELLEDLTNAELAEKPVARLEVSAKKNLGMFIGLQNGRHLFYRFSLNTRVMVDTAAKTGRDGDCKDIELDQTSCPPGFQLGFRTPALDIERLENFRFTASLLNDSLLITGDSLGKITVIDLDACRYIMNEELKVPSSTDDIKRDSRPDLSETEKLIPTALYLARTFLKEEKEKEEASWRLASLLIIGTQCGRVLAYELDDDLRLRALVAFSETSSPVLLLHVFDCRRHSLNLQSVVPEEPSLKNHDIKASKLRLPVDDYSHLMLAVWTDRVSVYHNISSLELFNFIIPNVAVRAEVIRIPSGVVQAVVIVSENGTVTILSLPTLQVLFIDVVFDPVHFVLESIQLTCDGRAVVQGSDGNLHHFYLFASSNQLHMLPESLGSLHDSRVTLPARDEPKKDHSTTSMAKNWLGTLTKAAFGSSAIPWANADTIKSQTKDLDASITLIKQAKQVENKSRHQSNERMQLLETAYDEPAPSAPVSSGVHAFNQAAQNLNERGERLQKLENKFANLADQSEGFLDSIREYNRKQAEKKWYDIF